MKEKIQFSDALLREARVWLKKKGWTRHDRASGPNESTENWQDKHIVGLQPVPLSLPVALRIQLQRENDGITTAVPAVDFTDEQGHLTDKTVQVIKDSILRQLDEKLREIQQNTVVAKGDKLTIN